MLTPIQRMQVAHIKEDTIQLLNHSLDCAKIEVIKLRQLMERLKFHPWITATDRIKLNISYLKVENAFLKLKFVESHAWSILSSVIAILDLQVRNQS